jgi:hypothetical protein
VRQTIADINPIAGPSVGARLSARATVDIYIATFATEVELLRLGFIALALFGVVGVWFAPPPPGSEINAFAVQIGLAALAAGIFGALCEWRGSPLHFRNHTSEQRIINFVNLLANAKREVVIVTGQLHSGLYSNLRVVRALKGLRKNVRIEVYHTRETIDAGSHEFFGELVKRRARIERIDLPRHAVIVDGRDVKLEEAGVVDDAPLKHVDYFYDDPACAKVLLRQIRLSRHIPAKAAR